MAAQSTVQNELTLGDFEKKSEIWRLLDIWKMREAMINAQRFRSSFDLIESVKVDSMPIQTP